MKKLLKVSLFLILLGISSIIFFYLCEGQSFIDTVKDIVISQNRSGIYSEENISNLDIDEKVSKNINSFSVRAKYIDIEVSKDINEIHIEYYILPNVKREANQNSDENYSVSFLDSNYEIVFNKNIDKYKRVKVTIPEDKKFDFFMASGQEIKINGVLAKNMIAVVYAIPNSVARISNVNADEMTVASYEVENVTINDSNIEKLKIQSGKKAIFEFTNLNGNTIIFNDKSSTITGFGNSKVILNNVKYKEQGYYTSNFDIEINNNMSLSDYYFNLITEGGKIKINDQDYTSNYESTNKDRSIYKIYVKSNNADLKIK